jgi:hypothetical protein
MSIWERVRRTGQRQARAFVFKEIPHAGEDTITAQPALIPGQDYFRIWLSEMFLGQRSTLTADWLPAAHARVSVTGHGRSPVEYSKMLRPDPEYMAQGVELNYQLTDLVPYNGGVVEVETALVAWQQANRLDAAVEVLQAVSAIPIPSAAPALKVAEQITSAAKTLVQKGDGAVHLHLHQSFVAPEDGEPKQPEPGNILRPTYLAVLLADENEVSPGALRVIDNRLCKVGADGQLAHLLGWDFLLMRVEGRSTRDDFWLPELQELLDKAVEALEAGQPSLAEHYRSAAIAIAWRSPAFTWTDRDRLIDSIKRRFGQVAERGLGVVAGRQPKTINEIVQQYAPPLEEVRARGPMTEAKAFAFAS